MSAADRWMNWEPKTRIFSKTPCNAPTKPSKPGCVGFVGANQGDFQKIEETSLEAEPRVPATDAGLTEAQTRALRLLNLAGVRIMRIGAELTIGIWEDLDCREIRQALRVVGLDVNPVLHLESAGVDLRFKVRRTPDRAKGESFAVWLKRAERTLPSVVKAYAQEMEEQPA